MKIYYKFLLFITIALFWYACENPEIVGSEDVNQINHVSFSITEYEATGTILKATGTIKNTGSAKITSPWYIDGEFYADDTKSLILGGDVKQMTIPLDRRVQTVWTLEFSDPEIIEGNYPDFVVSNLRAYYKE